MGKIIGNFCEFCGMADFILDFLPPEAHEFILDNGIRVISNDLEAEADDIIIEYPLIKLDKQTTIDYLLKEGTIKAPEELKNYLENVYLDSDFETLPVYLERNTDIDFESCITNKEELVKSILDQLEEDFDYDPDADPVYRIIFRTGEGAEAERCLDEEGLWYDYDSGDRMMLHKDGLNCLEKNGIDYDEV